MAKLDVLTSDVSLANARTNAVSAANNVSVAEANLNNIIGLPLQTKLVVADHRLPFDAYTISLDQAIAYAMTYRPEVLQSMLSVQKAKENIGIADAGNKPTISVGASNAWNDTDFPGTKNSRWGVSGGISYSFYDGGATNAKVHVESPDLDIAKALPQTRFPRKGHIVLNAYIGGTLSDPTAVGSIAADSLELNHMPVTGLKGDFGYYGGIARITDFSFHQGGGTYQASGYWNTSSGWIKAQASVSNGNIASWIQLLNLPLQKVNGTIDGEIIVGGTMLFTCVVWPSVNTRLSEW